MKKMRQRIFMCNHPRRCIVYLFRWSDECVKGGFAMKGKTYWLAAALACGLLMVFGGRLAAADEPAKVAGTWKISIETPRGTNEQTLTLEQDGATLKGTLTGRRGDSPVEGKVDGNKVSFSVKRETPNGTFTLEYSGTADGDSMTGTVHSERFDGKWTAKRGSAENGK
jgi:hypothetical protein